MIYMITIGSIFFVAVTMIITAIPLLRGRVQPNALYGIRTQQSLRDEASWYRINKIGGQAFVQAGVALIPLSLLPLVADPAQKPVIFTVLAVLPTLSVSAWAAWVVLRATRVVPNSG